ncbi:MAG: eCIS core domain-containing protein [Thermomicrobiales bacterium]
MESSTASRLAPRVGFDLGTIKIHADGEADGLSRSIGALAFTTSRDIFFRQGMYRPGTGFGDHLLAHELTHVAQQQPMRGDGPLTVGPANDHHEAAAEATADHIVSGRGSTQYATAQPTASIQRYQAGERGHGGIEDEALGKGPGGAGFDDVGAVYLGNWMRDFSQTNPGPSSKFYPLVVNLLNILFWGEFNRPLDASQLGGYLPSEHLDNPMGGKSPEDATATQKERDATYDSLSDEQKAELKQESDPAYKAKIEAASKASGLPDYIERGKQHSKTMFEKSINDKDPAQQQMDLGNGLHGVEDYFSHSNFTEVALATLAKSGNVAAGAVLDKAKKESDGFGASDAAKVGNDPLGRGAGIITGTYGPQAHANQIVSLVEQLKSEVLTGGLRKAFIIGSARLAGKKIGDEGKTLLGGAGNVVGTGIGAVAGGVGGAASGVASGVAKGYDEGHGVLGTIASVVAEGVSGAVHGLVSGGSQGAAAGGAEGKKLGGEVGEGAGTIGGEVLGGAEAIDRLGAASPLFAALDVAIKLELDEKISDAESKKSAALAPQDPTHTFKDPTHSQMAKDAPEHAVFATSRALAVEADKHIGAAMRDAWANADKPAAIASVLPLVDKFVSYPTSDPWWQPTLEAELAKTKS